MYRDRLIDCILSGGGMDEETPEIVGPHVFGFGAEKISRTAEDFSGSVYSLWCARLWSHIF